MSGLGMICLFACGLVFPCTVTLAQDAPRKILPAEQNTSDFLKRCFLPETFARLSSFDEVRDLRFTYQPTTLAKEDVAAGINWRATYRFQYSYRQGGNGFKDGETTVDVRRLNDDTYEASSLGSRINGKISSSCSFEAETRQ